jgi:small GTP-binding protein
MASHISIKFLVVGDENVGKTTIINYFTLAPVKSAAATAGIDFQSRIVALSAEKVGKGEMGEGSRAQTSKSESESLLLSTMKVGGADPVYTRSRHTDYDYVKCCFWDTSGSSNYQCLAQTYYTGIAAVIVVFDLSNNSSYKNINSYIIRVIQKNNCNHRHPILVLGNKLDKRSINFTKKQVFESLCFDFPYDSITYDEVSSLDKLNTACAGCAHSSDIHVVMNSFIQSLYDSVVKPHYYNPQAIADIGCRGITGSSRFFKEQLDKKGQGQGQGPGWNWNWKGGYADYIHGTGNKDDKNYSHDGGGGVNYIQMTNLPKVARECCNEQGLQRASSCTSGCSIM